MVEKYLNGQAHVQTCVNNEVNNEKSTCEVNNENICTMYEICFM